MANANIILIFDAITYRHYYFTHGCYLKMKFTNNLNKNIIYAPRTQFGTLGEFQIAKVSRTLLHLKLCGIFETASAKR